VSILAMLLAPLRLGVAMVTVGVVAMTLASGSSLCEVAGTGQQTSDGQATQQP
jgi:hypothetical protein